METELAQELKKAGYLQPDVEDELEYEGSFRSTTDGDVYVPTLSELIEACGEDFDALGKCKDDGVSIIIDGWIAVDKDNQRTWGKTAEEAVALLWLAIHS